MSMYWWIDISYTCISLVGIIKLHLYQSDTMAISFPTVISVGNISTREATLRGWLEYHPCHNCVLLTVLFVLITCNLCVYVVV